MLLQILSLILLTLQVVAFKTSSSILSGEVYKCELCEKKDNITKEEVTEHLRETIIGMTLARKHLRNYENEFKHRLHRENFRVYATYNPEPWDDAVFMYYLDVERSKIEDIVDIEDSSMTTTMHNENITSNFTINIKYITNCTLSWNYSITSKFVTDSRRYEILEVAFKPTTGWFHSNWKSQNDSKPLPEGNEFAKEFCGKLNFFEHFDEDEKLVGTVETSTSYKFGLAEFKEYLTHFFTKYKQSNKSKKYTMTRDNDHIVFRCVVPFKYLNEPDSEKWNFDIEAIYNNSKWNLAKVFLGHNFLTNQIVFDREARYFGRVLAANIISQITGKTRRSGFDHENSDEVGFQIDVFENNSTYVHVCPELLPHPHPQNQYLKVRLPAFMGNLHVYSHVLTRTLVVDLYFPDTLGMRIHMSFEIVDTGVLNSFNTVKYVSISCPEISAPPTEGKLEIIRMEEEVSEDENSEDELVDSSLIIT